MTNYFYSDVASRTVRFMETYPVTGAALTQDEFAAKYFRSRKIVGQMLDCVMLDARKKENRVMRALGAAFFRSLSPEETV